MMKKIVLSLVVIAGSGAYVWQQSGRAVGDDLLGPPPLAGDPLETGSIARRLLTSTAIGSAVIQPAAPKAAVEASPPSPPAGSPHAEEAFVVPPNPKPTAPPPGIAAAKVETRPPETPPLPSPKTSPIAIPAPAQTVATAPLPRPRPAYHAPGVPENAVPFGLTPVAMTVAASGGYADGVYVGPVTDAYWGLLQVEATVQGGRLVGIRVLKYPSDRRTSVYINRQALPMLRDEVVRAQSVNVDIVSGATLTSEAFIRSLGGALRKARSS